jgi:hypothetical protein
MSISAHKMRFGDCSSLPSAGAKKSRQVSSEERIFAGMADILESAPKYHEEPKLIIRKAPHVPVWSVWATLEGTHSEELFEGSTEEEASNWINSAGQVWLEERRRKRNA